MIIHVKKAKYISNYNIAIDFDNGEKGIVDLSFLSWNGVFESIKNLENFKKFKVNKEIGTICWENGADIAPDTLYQKIQTS